MGCRIDRQLIKMWMKDQKHFKKMDLKFRQPFKKMNS